MRATLTIDERTARALEDLAQRSSRSFEEVVNETLPAGLAANHARLSPQNRSGTVWANRGSAGAPLGLPRLPRLWSGSGTGS
jgi:hypothetical protein